jgi:hypothetical protein
MRRALVLALALTACAHGSGGVALRVDANVPEATVLVDDVLVGRAAEWTAAAAQTRHVRAGFHRVEVRAPGYYSVYREIDERDGGSVVVKADLKPLLD